MAGVKRKIDMKEALLVGKIKKMHDAGMSSAEIASKIKRPETMVRYYLTIIKQAMENKANKVEE